MPGPRIASRTKKRASRLSLHVERIGTTCALLSWEKLIELCRRDEEQAHPDGYGRGVSERGGRGGHGDPTAGTVVARETDHTIDPVHASVARVFDLVRTAARAMDEAERLVGVVLNTAESRRGRESSLQSTCTVDACETSPAGVGDDRLRRGLCPACYQAWVRWKMGRDPSPDPGSDRRAFVLSRSEQLRARDAESPEWRIAAIDVMQAAGSLPAQSVAS
jgi:hypothetical protein